MRVTITMIKKWDREKKGEVMLSTEWGKSKSVEEREKAKKQKAENWRKELIKISAWKYEKEKVTIET